MNCNPIFLKERLRELQAAAAEKRMRENESKGIKNLENVKRQQARKEEQEKLESYQGSNSGNLRVKF